MVDGGGGCGGGSCFNTGGVGVGASLKESGFLGLLLEESGYLGIE